MVMQAGGGGLLRGRARFKPFVGNYELVKHGIEFVSLI